MRARNLKPGFFKNEDLADIEPYGRLLFQGLWCMADREGRLEDRPKRIRVEVLPYDNCNIDKLLTALHNHGFIVRYSIDSQNYIQITNFRKHQYPHMKEPESTIPAPDEYQTSTIPAPDENRSCPSESPILNPESLEPISSSSPPEKRAADDGFDVFWKEYPRKIGKQAALKSWQKLRKIKKLPSIDKILQAVREQTESEQWQKDNGQFIPHPSTWLNQGRWEDQPTKILSGAERWLQQRTSATS